MAATFQITELHRKWARRRQTVYGGRSADYVELIRKQSGKCALSGVELTFDPDAGGGSVKGGPGCHPLYAALDHRSPRSTSSGFQIVCYALNDLKGHLPIDCFRDLQRAPSWKRLMAAWRRQFRTNPEDREAFHRLIFPNL